MIATALTEAVVDILVARGVPRTDAEAFAGSLEAWDHFLAPMLSRMEIVLRGTAARDARLAANAYVGQVVDHLDGDRYNNDIANLRIVPGPHENARPA